MTHHFGRRLRRLRAERSQKEVAEALKLAPTTYSSLEQQETVPRGPILERLAVFFGVQVDYFYPPREPKSVESAKQWLSRLKDGKLRALPTIATHADILFDETAKARFAQNLRQRIAESEGNS